VAEELKLRVKSFHLFPLRQIVEELDSIGPGSQGFLNTLFCLPKTFIFADYEYVEPPSFAEEDFKYVFYISDTMVQLFLFTLFIIDVMILLKEERTHFQKCLFGVHS